MQSGLLPQLTVALVLTAKGKILLTVRVQLLIAVSKGPSQLIVSIMTALQHCRAFCYYYSAIFLEHSLMVNAGPLESLLA